MPISGSSPNKTYTRSDGTRTGAAVCQQKKAASLNNTAVLADARENDIATAPNMMLMKDGGNQATANLPMAGYKHTGVGEATGSGQYAEYAQMVAADAVVTAAFQAADAVVTATLQPLDSGLTDIAGWPLLTVISLLVTGVIGLRKVAIQFEQALG